MKIYTKTGDQGDTGLFGGARVSKASLRVEAYGEVDELNSVLGMVRAEAGFDSAVSELLEAVQSQLFNLGAELATAPDSKAALGIPLVSEQEIGALEQGIDRAEAELSPLKTFVLPGGSRAAAALHLARTVCRRAERTLVELAASENVRPECLRYLNRLSDAL
ncbi:MAG TPA: cob(I)yrinic acid a,c-diamide adenosyltransferase, partial [Polyangiales bacterium]